MASEPTYRICPDCGDSYQQKGPKRCYCPRCEVVRSKAAAAKRRAKIGDDAYLAERRAATARSRAKNGRKAEKAYQRGVYRASKALREAHPEEYRMLLSRELAVIELTPETDGVEVPDDPS